MNRFIIIIIWELNCELMGKEREREAGVRDPI